MLPVDLEPNKPILLINQNFLEWSLKEIQVD